MLFPAKWNFVCPHISLSESSALCSPETSWWLATWRILHSNAWSWSSIIQFSCKGTEQLFRTSKLKIHKLSVWPIAMPGNIMICVYALWKLM